MISIDHIELSTLMEQRLTFPYLCHNSRASTRHSRLESHLDPNRSSTACLIQQDPSALLPILLIQYLPLHLIVPRLKVQIVYPLRIPLRVETSRGQNGSQLSLTVSLKGIEGLVVLDENADSVVELRVRASYCQMNRDHGACRTALSHSFSCYLAAPATRKYRAEKERHT